MTVPLVRKRARRPKVKTGCRTCRARHIKCGEEKPTCLNCGISGRECAGYDIFKPPARSRPALLQPDGVQLTVLLPILTAGLPTLPRSMSAKDRSALDYFLTCAFQDLPGNSWTMSWQNLILPYCRSEPAILNAAMAVGSLQRAMTDGEATDLSRHYRGHFNMALSQYGKSASVVRNAIEKIGEKASTADIETVLTTCLLLFSFEVLNGRDEHAAIHLRHGLKILYEHTRPAHLRALPNSHPRPIELQVSARSRIDLLTQTFIRLDADLSELVDYGTFLSPVSSRPVPKSFSSLEEAVVFVDILHSQVRTIGCELDALAEEELQITYAGYEALDEDLRAVLNFAKSRAVSLTNHPQLQQRMKAAKQSVSDFTAALATLPSSPDQPGANRVLVEITVFFVWFDACVDFSRLSDEMEIDRFDQQFEYILDLCEQYFASDKTTSSRPVFRNLTRPAFVTGTCVGQAVCLIVEKSRNSLLRRRGIRLLASMDMRGVFDGAFLASFYRHVVETEEMLAREILGLPEGHVFRYNEIPAEARFVEVDTAGADVCDEWFSKKEVGRMVYVRLMDRDLKVADYLFPVQRPFVWSVSEGETTDER